jgi:hypothetical protein
MEATMGFEFLTEMLQNLVSNVIGHYQEDNMRLIGLATWFIAWRAAYLLSKDTKHAFKAHVLYSISNVCLLVFNLYYGHIEMALMALTFLSTSIKGCFTYRPKNVVTTIIQH